MKGISIGALQCNPHIHITFGAGRFDSELLHGDAVFVFQRRQPDHQGIEARIFHPAAQDIIAFRLHALEGDVHAGIIRGNNIQQ